MRADARLDEPVPTGAEGEAVPLRDHLRKAASMGSKAAQRKLDAVPACPEELDYLVHLARALSGRSGCSAVGLLPLAHTTLLAWSQLYGETLTPMECDALFALDAAMLYPGKAEAKRDDDTPKVPARDRWPKRKEA